jgi:hypothetical protein
MLQYHRTLCVSRSRTILYQLHSFYSFELFTIKLINVISKHERQRLALCNSLLHKMTESINSKKPSRFTEADSPSAGH